MDPSLLLYVTCAAALAAVLSGLRIIPEDVVMPLHRFGRFHRVLAPGWHLVVPFLDRLGLPVSLIGHRVVVDADGTRRVGAEVLFQILDPLLAGREIEQVDRLVRQTTTERLEQMLPAAAGPEQVNWLKSQLNGALQPLGVRVTRCQLR